MYPLICCCITLAKGQSIVNESVSSNHVSVENNGIQVSSALGEVGYEGGESADVIVVEGSIQPHLLFNITLEEIKDVIEVKIYPNPTSDRIYINTTYKTTLDGFVYDVNGKVLEEFKLNKSEELNFGKYAPGLYSVTLVDKISQKRNTYKIINK